MKKILVILFISISCFAQTAAPIIQKSYSFTTTGNEAIVPVFATGIHYYKVIWTNLGRVKPATCRFKVLGSSDNFVANVVDINFFNCVSDGISSPFLAVTSYVRINVDDYVPSVSNNILNVTIQGYTSRPY